MKLNYDEKLLILEALEVLWKQEGLSDTIINDNKSIKNSTILITFTL